VVENGVGTTRLLFGEVRVGFDVFINYRTVDVGFGAAAVYELLAERFGKDRIFLDNQSMAPGDDYPRALRVALESMRVLLVLIGPRWLDVDPDNRQPGVFPFLWTRFRAAISLISLYPSSYSRGVKYPSVECRRCVL
jgi:hypothetical protein